MQNILTVKKFISPITNEFAGYIVDDNGIKKTVLIGSKSYLEIEKWLSQDGNNLSPTFTDKELQEREKMLQDEEKEKSLDKLTVTTDSGKVFYADSEARTDLLSAIYEADLKGLTSSPWKLAEPWVVEGEVQTPIKDEKIYVVTLEELREASRLALESKGNIIGAL